MQIQSGDITCPNKKCTVPPSVLETRPANWAVGAFIPSGGGNAVPNLISSSDRLAPCNKEKQLQTNSEEENVWHIEKLDYLVIFDLLDRYKPSMILLFFFSHF